jgi:hypothetical protein
VSRVLKLFGIWRRLRAVVVVVVSGKEGRGEETLSVETGDKWMAGETVALAQRWPIVAACPDALVWLQVQADLGLAPRTVEAYARGLTDYLAVCGREGIDPLVAGRAEIARYVRELNQRPSRRGANVVALDSGVGLANATLQQRLVAVRLFYDHLIEEGRRETNPVGRGRYTPGKAFGGLRERGLIPRFTKLPWIPSDDQWRAIVVAAANHCAIGSCSLWRTTLGSVVRSCASCV